MTTPRDDLQALASRLDDAAIQAIIRAAREYEHEGFRALRDLLVSAALHDTRDPEEWLERLGAVSDHAGRVLRMHEAFIREWRS